jgi:hypothetical protein
MGGGFMMVQFTYLRVALRGAVFEVSESNDDCLADTAMAIWRATLII